MNDYITRSGVKGIFLSPAFYYQNFHIFFPPKKDADNNIVFSLPYSESATLTGVDIKEIGTAVSNILKSPDEYVGKVTPVWGMHASVSDYLKQFTEATGKQTKFEQLPQNAVGEELGNMFGFFEEYQLFGPNLDSNLQKKVNPQAKSFGEWVKETGLGSDL